jgi:malonate transporter
MDLRADVVNFIAMFLFMVASTFYLRWRNILRPAAAPVIARLVTEFVLPALLIRQLAAIQIDWLTGQAVIATLAAEIIVGVFAFLIARFLFRLPPASIAVFVLCSTFGSTALIGNAFIKVVFDDDIKMTAASLIIGQLATGLPNNLLGPAIMMRCGTDRDSRFVEQLKHVILNPPFLAIIVGVAWGALRLPTSGVIFSPVFFSLKLCGDTLPFLVAALTGLSMRGISLRGLGPIVIACCLLLLVLEPALVNYFIDLFGQPIERQQLTFLLAAMPASPLAVAFAVRYGGDEKLAGTLVLATTVVSAISLPLLMPFFDQFRV